MPPESESGAFEISDIGVDSILEAAGLDSDPGPSAAPPPPRARQAPPVVAPDDSGGFGLSDIEGLRDPRPSEVREPAAPTTRATSPVPAAQTTRATSPVPAAPTTRATSPVAAAPRTISPPPEPLVDQRAPTPQAVIVPPIHASPHAAETMLAPDPNDFSLGFGDDQGLNGLSAFDANDGNLSGIASGFFERADSAAWEPPMGDPWAAPDPGREKQESPPPLLPWLDSGVHGGLSPGTESAALSSLDLDHLSGFEADDTGPVSDSAPGAGDPPPSPKERPSGGFQGQAGIVMRPRGPAGARRGWRSDQ